ncbi:RNA-directed DNA polymerase, eukaryota, reverse transcriptase zinc-binding domain protein [Tanacetum coccineum]
MLICWVQSRSIEVASKLSYGGLDHSFRRKPRGGVEQAQFELLKEKVDGIILNNSQDRWNWSLVGSGEFSVSSVRKLIDDVLLPTTNTKTRWINVVPIKINVHAWKVKHDCLPTRFNLSRRGMEIESILCPMCDCSAESSRHLFFSCKFVSDVMRKITRWWDMDYQEINSFEDWCIWISSLRLPSKLKQIFEGARDEVGLSSVVQLMSIDVVIGEEFGSWRKRTKEDTRSCRSTKEDELRLCDIFVDRLLFSKARSRLELLRKARGRRQVAREDDRGVTEGREVVRKVFQQHGSRAKRKLSRYGRNQIGNEPILALPKGADDFVVYCDTRSKDLKACLEKGRRCINEQDMESNLEFDFKPLPSGKGNVEVVPWSREEKSEAKNEFEIDVGTLSIEERIRQSNDYPCLERYDVCVVLRGKANSLAVGFGLWKLVEIMLPRLFVCQGTVDVGPRVMIKSVYESIIESSLGFESVVLAYFGTKDQM